MQFLYPALTAGFFLALVPLLIHLINLMRHRRVKWAAMDFLLQSYKKHRKWVWLRQLLLLLARMTAVALVVAMLAQLVTQSRYEGLFGSSLTHHYVLLDDSMSMSDRAGGTDTLERGLNFARQLGMEAARQELRQRFSLLRFSRAEAAADASATSNAESIPRLADLNAEDIDSTFPSRLEQIRNTIKPTELPVGPESALRVARQLMQESSEENRIVYLVSDFRTNQWDNPSELRELLSELEQDGTKLHLVNCCRTRRDNLAITELKPTKEIRAAGVPLFMNVAITNYGTTTAENVQIKVRTHLYESIREQLPENEQPASEVDDSPTLQIDQIKPGETAVQRVQVFFPQPGKHVVEAILPEDTVAADNRRWCVVDFPEHESVLIVDGDPYQRNAFFIEAIFDPGQRARTGIESKTQSEAFLRDSAPETLRPYTAIYLFDVERLDDRAITNLETYVAEGGGLAVFVGPQVDLSFYNQRLYREGEGLFPLALDRDALLEVDPVLDPPPDIVVEAKDHPVFRELVQGQNPIVRMMHVQRYLRPPADWVPANNSSVRVPARLRSRAPLAVEKTFGKGRVMAFLTTYAPYWNDITLGPGALLALRLQSHLGAARRTTTEHEVGTNIQLRLDGTTYREDVRLFSPEETPGHWTMGKRVARKPSEDSESLRLDIEPAETARSGIYETWFRHADGSFEADRFAVNVNARESNLAQTSTRDIVSHLDPVPVEIGYADQYETAALAQAGFNQSLLLMVLLVLLLIGEQVLAYFAGYHPSRRGGKPAAAGPSWRGSPVANDDEEDRRAIHAATRGHAERGADQGSQPARSTTTNTGQGAQR